MKLYIARHGEAVEDTIDPERPLTANGRRQLENLSSLIKQQGHLVQQVFHSKKLRTLQTATILGNAISPGTKLQLLPAANPGSSVEVLVEEIGLLDKDTLIVSHMPLVAMLVSQLLTGDVRTLAVKFTPGTIFCLEKTYGPWILTWLETGSVQLP